MARKISAMRAEEKLGGFATAKKHNTTINVILPQFLKKFHRVKAVCFTSSDFKV